MSTEGQSGGGKAEAGEADCAVGISEKLLVVSLFASQGRLSLHLLTLWEAQVGPGLHPGRGLQEGARDESLVTGAEGSRSFRPGPYQLHHPQPALSQRVRPACKDQGKGWRPKGGMSNAHRRCNDVSCVHKESGALGKRSLADVKTFACQSRCTEHLSSTYYVPHMRTGE